MKSHVACKITKISFLLKRIGPRMEPCGTLKRFLLQELKTSDFCSLISVFQIIVNDFKSSFIESKRVKLR